MRRRDALTSLALIATAGCLAPSGGGSPETTTTTEDGTDTTTTTTTEETTTEPTTQEPTTTTETTGETTTPGGSDWSIELTPTDIHCASEDAGGASVSFGDADVTVTGTVIGSDMCYLARLDRASFDSASGELVIVVESYRKDEDAVCAQCISGIDYEVTATFTDALPSKVVVKHARDGEERTVTTATK